MAKAEWPVWYSNGLSDLVAEVVGEAGSQRAAAKALGVSEPTIRGLLRGRNHLTGRIAARILARLDPDKRLRFEVYCGRHEMRALDMKERLRLQKALGIGSRLVENSSSPAAQLRELLYNELRGKRDLRDLFTGFERSMVAVGLRVIPGELRRMDLRAQFAYERLLRPLLDAELTEGLDPTWRQLERRRVRGKGKRRSQLWRFLDLGMNQGRILLGSDAPDARVAKTAATRHEKEIQRRALEMMLLGEGRTPR